MTQLPMITSEQCERVLSDIQSDQNTRALLDLCKTEPILSNKLDETLRDLTSFLMEAYPTIKESQPRIFADINIMVRAYFLRGLQLGRDVYADRFADMFDELPAEKDFRNFV